MRRMSIVLGMVAMMIVTLAYSSGAVSAQDAPTTSDSPFIGAWLVQSHLDGGATGPNLTSFLPGGIVITSNNPVFPAADDAGLPQVRALGQGNWTVVDANTVDFTFIVLTTDADGGNAGMRQINARFVINATGNAITGQYTAIVKSADGTIVSESRGAASGTRIAVEQIDLAATPIAF